MEQSEIGKISEMVKTACVAASANRSARRTCRAPTCSTARATRSSATSLLVEAFLYEEQTRRGISLTISTSSTTSPTIARSATVASSPVPVDIDFGDVSVAMRNFLRKQDKKRFSPGTAAAMAFLTPRIRRRSSDAQRMMEFGFKAQRLAHKAAKAVGLVRIRASTRRLRSARRRSRRRSSTSSTGRCRATCPSAPRAPCSTSRTTRSSGHPQPEEDDRGFRRRLLLPRLRLGAPVLAGRPGDAGDALRNRRDTTVLPPGYLCCGYPQTSSGDEDKGQKITTDNRVLFHRVANTLNLSRYQDGDRSCGTCMDQLQKYQFEKIFPAAACSTSTNT